MATTHAQLDDALARAAKARDADLSDLIDELRIPSISTLPERHEDCLRNAQWLRDRLQAMGMKVEIVEVTKSGNPVVVG